MPSTRATRRESNGGSCRTFGRATLLAQVVCGLHVLRSPRGVCRRGAIMAEELKLNKPLLVAVWPGMGHVAISAGYYLMAKLDMHLLAEFLPRGLFEFEHVEIKHGLIRMGRLPRSRFFVWRNPGG